MIKKVKRRTPSGRVSIRLRRKKPRFASCASCGKPLHGVPRLIPSELKKLPKSSRRPSRKYGGYYCSSCSREFLREKVRKFYFS